MSAANGNLLVTNARPWSDGAPVAGADAVAVAGGRVLAVGRGTELEPLAAPGTRRVDARGATVTPGLTDSHLHLVGWARAREEIALDDADSLDAALERVRRQLAERPGGGPVMGRGWDLNRWQGERPHAAALDRVSGERPVLLHSRDFHALWVNGAALRRAGITRATPDPPGGRFERDARGEPDGIVREHAVRAFAALEAEAGAGPGGDLERVRRAVGELHALGITAVHDFEGAEAQRVLRALTLGPGPRVRVLMHLAHAGLDAALALGLASGTGDDWFRIGAVKLFADGTLGSRTAAMLEPYDGTDERGMELIPAPLLAAEVTRAHAGGLAVAVHAIGDRAVRSTLDAVAAATRSGARAGHPAKTGPPPRIEHAQLVHPDDLPRFASLGVVASLQPTHCTSDLDLVERWWKTRAAHSYPWRALLARGVPLVFGSDAPVEPPDPAAGLHAAVTRERADGTPRGGFQPAQRLSLDEALEAYTGAPARLAGGGSRLGRLAPGAAGDLVVWDADLHGLPPERLRAARPRLTAIEGRIVYEAGARTAAAGVLATARAGER